MEARDCQGSGLWNSYPVKYSEDTHKLLKVMMEESKISNTMRKKINDDVNNGKSLPLSTPKKKITLKKITPKTVLNPRNYSGGLRSKEQIEQINANNTHDMIPTSFKVKPPDRSKEKDRLAHLMAFGTEISVEKKKKEPPPSRQQTFELDRFDELTSEIAERRHFLEEMEKLGKAEQYRSQIETEISKLILEMEIIDKKRDAELEKLKKMKNQQ